MKINRKYLALYSRDISTAEIFWRQIATNFIDGIDDMTLAQRQGITVQELKDSRSMMVTQARQADFIEKCPLFYFTRPALEISKKIEVNKLPLSVFNQIKLKKGKIVVAEKDFYLWTFLDHKNELIISRYYLELESNGDESINFTYSTIDFDADKLRTNPYEEQSNFLDDRMRQLMYFLFLADNTQVEIKPGRHNGLGKKSGKILNETKEDIIEVRSDFNITRIGLTSGHWRNQPYGPKDEPEYKLIWIEAYQREIKSKAGTVRDA